MFFGQLQNPISSKHIDLSELIGFFGRKKMAFELFAEIQDV